MIYVHCTVLYVQCTSVQDIDQNSFVEETFHTAEDRFYAPRLPEERFYEVKQPQQLQRSPEGKDDFYNFRESSNSLPDRKSDRIGSAYWKTDPYEDDLPYEREQQPYGQTRNNYDDYNPKWAGNNRDFDSSYYARPQSGANTFEDRWDDPPTTNTNDFSQRYDDLPFGSRYDYAPAQVVDRYNALTFREPADRYDLFNAITDRFDGPSPGGQRNGPGLSLPGYTSILTASLGVQDEGSTRKKGESFQ